MEIPIIEDLYLFLCLFHFTYLFELLCKKKCNLNLWSTFQETKFTLRRDFGCVRYSPCRLQSSQGFMTVGHSACLASNRISKRLFRVPGISVVCLVLSFFCNLLCLSSCLQIKSTSEQPRTIHFFLQVFLLIVIVNQFTKYKQGPRGTERSILFSL